MFDKKAVFIVLVIGIMFFSCCTNMPGLPKFIKKNETSTTQGIISMTTTLDLGESSCSGGECCIDDNHNDICDIDESSVGVSTLPEVTSTTLRATTSSSLAPTTTAVIVSTTTVPAATTTQATAATTTTTAANASTPTAKQCSAAGECGESYYGGCTCMGSEIRMSKYIPTCRNGTCVYLSRSERVLCQDIETTDETVISEKCVQGYGICITKEAIENYLTTPAKAKQITNLSKSEFSGEYFGYRFKLENMEYAGATRCFDSMKFNLRAMTPTGLTVPLDLTWNKTMSNKDITVGIDNIRIGGNGSPELSVWVLEKD